MDPPVAPLGGRPTEPRDPTGETEPSTGSADRVHEAIPNVPGSVRRREEFPRLGFENEAKTEFRRKEIALLPQGP
jgi:hypothetical protein